MLVVDVGGATNSTQSASRSGKQRLVHYILKELKQKNLFVPPIRMVRPGTQQQVGTTMK